MSSTGVAWQPARARSAVCAALLSTLAWTRVAHADSGAAAEALFEAGRAASKRGDTQGACVRFRESHRLDPAPGTKLNLATCEAELGKLAVAWRLLRSLDQTLPADDPRVGVVRELLGKLDGRVPRVVLESAGSLPPGLQVVLDGAALSESSFGVPIPVDPGSHTVEVRRKSQPLARWQLTLVEGEHRVVPIIASAAETPLAAPLAAAPPPPVPAPAPPRREATAAAAPRESHATLAIVMLGAAAATLAVGAVTGLRALDYKETVDALCDPGGCDPGGTRAARLGSTSATVSTVSVILGTALAGVGVTLLVLDRPTGKPHRAKLSVTTSGTTLAFRVGF